MSNNTLDMMDAKIKLRDYLDNAPKKYFVEGTRLRKNKTEKVDAIVVAHTADQAKQKFVSYFSINEFIATATSCIRKPGYIEKNNMENYT